jgi:hypothetical protein
MKRKRPSADLKGDVEQAASTHRPGMTSVEALSRRLEEIG